MNSIEIGGAPFSRDSNCLRRMHIYIRIVIEFQWIGFGKYGILFWENRTGGKFMKNEFLKGFTQKVSLYALDAVFLSFFSIMEL